MFPSNDNLTYFDVEFLEGGSVIVETYQNEKVLTKSYKLNADKNGDIRNFLYFQEVLIDEAVSKPSFIGLGFSEWVVAIFSLSTNYLDKDCNEVSENDPNAYISWNNYTNYAGVVVAYRKSYVDGTKKDERYKIVNGTFVEIDEKEFSELTKEEISPPIAYPSYANAYRHSYEFPDNKAYETDYFYTRTYGYSYVSDKPTIVTTWDSGVSLLSTNFIAENENFVIDNLFKEGFDNFIHPNPYTAKGTYFNIDMGKKIQASSITFNGRLPNGATNTQQGFPHEFAIYISNDNKEYVKVGDFVNNDGSGNNDERAVNVEIGMSITFRYINITIESSNSNTGRIILSRIKFSYTLNLQAHDNNVKIINSDEVSCYGQWETKPAFSSFGHVYVGKKNSHIKFEFTGTRLGILTSKRFKTNYQVNIDGKTVNSIEVKEFTKEFGITYISERLSNKNHMVEIQCNGEANFDCFTYYTDPDE